MNQKEFTMDNFDVNLNNKMQFCKASYLTAIKYCNHQCSSLDKHIKREVKKTYHNVIYYGKL